MYLSSTFLVFFFSFQLVAQDSGTVLYTLAENEHFDLNKTVHTGILTIKRDGQLINITSIDQRLQLENPLTTQSNDIVEKEGLFYLLMDHKLSHIGYSYIKKIYSNFKGDLAFFLKHPDGNQLWLNGHRQAVFFDDIDQFYFNSDLQKFNGVASYYGKQIIIQNSSLVSIPYKIISNLIRDSLGNIYYYEASDLYNRYNIKNWHYSLERYKKGELLYLSSKQEITLIKKLGQQYIYRDGVEILGPFIDLLALYGSSSDDTIFLLRQSLDRIVLEQLNLVI